MHGPEVPPLLCWFICLFLSMEINHGVLYHVVAAVTTAASLLSIGRAAEHLADCLSNGVTVNAKDSEQLLGLAAAWHLGNGQAVDGETGLIHYC